MRLSEAWLREWVNPELDTQQLADQLSMAGLEVAGVQPVAPPFSGVVVAEVLTVAHHPQAEKLHLCQVNAGEGEPLAVVCGASNVAPGLRVPLARVGARMPGGQRIDKAKLRGAESFGMLCSGQELGLEERSEGLLILPPDAPVGTDLRVYLGLDDQSIELNLTPDRGDCLSLAGVAREMGVLNRLPVQAPVIEPVAAGTEATLPVQLSAPEACPRYVCRVIRGIDPNARTPLWMRERLRRSGLRSISPVVDVTNYILLELGQPMHAFDLERIAGGIQVRMADAGERLTLLDGQELTLRADTLVIADAQRAVALAGIMGGQDSGVGTGTRHILLESAFFAPLAVGGRARSYGLATDSAHRFERGVDPELQIPALQRATRLLLDIVGGTPGPLVEANAPEHLPSRAPVRLRRHRIGRVLGIEIDDQTVTDILERLGMGIQAAPDGWILTPPSGRFDIALEEDLIEELGRVYGYTEIPMTHAVASTVMEAQPETRFDLRRAANLLVDRGYQEVVTYSFISPELHALVTPDDPPISLANPLSLDLSVMRASLWPGLLSAARYNQSRQQERVRIFESGLRFRRTGEDIDQAPMLAGLIVGDRLPEQWGEARRSLDFFDGKADVEALLALGGANGEDVFVAAQHPALHPGQCARIERQGREAGWIGMLHPELARTLDLRGDVYLFELSLREIAEGVLPAYQALSPFPWIRRDLALLLDKSISYQRIRDCVQSAVPEILKDILIFDVYTGSNIDSGRRSVALGLIFQDSSHTLTDQEGESLIGRIRRQLSEQLGATLRE